MIFMGSFVFIHWLILFSSLPPSLPPSLPRSWPGRVCFRLSIRRGITQVGREGGRVYNKEWMRSRQELNKQNPNPPFLLPSIPPSLAVYRTEP